MFEGIFGFVCGWYSKTHLPVHFTSWGYSLKYVLSTFWQPFVKIHVMIGIYVFLMTFRLGAIHKLCQPKIGGSRPHSPLCQPLSSFPKPPIPPFSAIVSISRTPPPSLCQLCQRLPNPPFLFCVTFVNIFNATLFLNNLFVFGRK